MKRNVFVFLIVVLGYCYSQTVLPQKINEDVRKLILEEGYPVKNYTVQTEDGYILDLIRMPNYQKNFTQEEISQYTGNEEDVEVEGPFYHKQAVLLMPGLMGSFEDFVIGGASEGLAFALADVGYDVFIGNPRGSIYGRKHANLNPLNDDEFWNYSFHQMGVKDLPAIVDKVLEISGESKIKYVGHMEGATIFFVMASEKPEYNNKIDKIIALGPIAFMKHSRHKIFKEVIDECTNVIGSANSITESIWTSEWIKNKFGSGLFIPPKERIETIKDACIKKLIFDEQTCDNFHFIMNGITSTHFNTTTLHRYIPRASTLVSAKHVFHYSQMQLTGEFIKYNENLDIFHPSFEEYDLSKVTTPAIIFYTSNDAWYTVEDAEKLVSKLPHVTYHSLVENLTNQMDFIFTKDIRDAIYNNVIAMLKQVIQHA